jgi:arsenate reductase
MSEYTIYHNPRCSKSRTTLALLQNNGIAPEVVLYLETGPDSEALRALLIKLNMDAAQLIRRGEDAYAECRLSGDSSEEELLSAMASKPNLIERPIVIRGARAVIGRPPENIFELLDK